MIVVNQRCEERPRGFTLLEVLLAVTILGIILTTVYGVLSRTLFSKKIAEERVELFASGRQAVLKMVGDLEGALPPPSGDRIYFRGAGGLGEVPSVEFVAMNRGGYGFHRVRPGRVLIVYTLDEIPNRRDIFALRREEYLFSAMLAEADETAPSTDDEEDAAPTAIATYLLDCPELPDGINLVGSCSRVVGLQFRYYDEVVSDWRDYWDSTEQTMQGRLPAAVEVMLVLEDERGSQHDFTTIVDLPLARGQPTPRPGEAATIGGGEDDQDDPEGDSGSRRGRPSWGRDGK